MIRGWRITIIVWAIFLISTGLAGGKEFDVSDETQFQNALAEAAANGEDDIIRLEQGTYIGNFVFDSFEGKNLALLGGFDPGFNSRTLDPSNTILDGNHAGRVLYVDNSGLGWGGDILIEGFTIQNGNAADLAGGIYAASCVMGYPGRIIIKDNIVKDNSASSGGGICAYTDDEAFGPLLADKMDVKIGKKKIFRIFPYRLRIQQFDRGKISIVNNRIENNSGGGIVAKTNGDMEAGFIDISANSIRNNTGSGVVAGSFAGSIKLSDNMISGNKSAVMGGGVNVSSYGYFGSGGWISFFNNIISKNSSDEGGGVFAEVKEHEGELILINNTITENTCSGIACGAFLKGSAYGSVIYVCNNIVWGNAVLTGADIHLEYDPDIPMLSEAWGFNNDYSSLSGTWTHSGSNIDSNPRFADAENGDFHLRSASPCIDKGRNDVRFLPAEDFEGDPRILDGNFDGTATVDIGVDEFVTVPLYTLTILSSNGGSTSPSSGEHRYVQGTDVVLTAVPDDHFRFSHWSGDADGVDNPITITMDSDKSIKANFVRQYTLTLASGTGGITAPSPGVYVYDKGTTVTVTAIPEIHYVFSHWSGDVSRTANPMKITINKDMSIAANFIRIVYPPQNLTGQKVLNRSLALAEYINVLTWQSNPDNMNIVKYRIYLTEGTNRHLLIELNAGTFQYWHRKVEKNMPYAYSICAVNYENRESIPINIIVQ